MFKSNGFSTIQPPGSYRPAASDLQLVVSDSSNNQTAPVRRIIINSIFNDLELLQKQFGRFIVFGRVDAEHWAAAFEAYLQHNYHSVDEICAHFHAFLDDSQFSSWYFSLKDETWSTLKVKFLEKARSIEFQYQTLCIEKQGGFSKRCLELQPGNAGEHLRLYCRCAAYSYEPANCLE